MDACAGCLGTKWALLADGLEISSIQCPMCSQPQVSPDFEPPGSSETPAADDSPTSLTINWTPGPACGLSPFSVRVFRIDHQTGRLFFGGMTDQQMLAICNNAPSLHVNQKLLIAMCSEVSRLRQSISVLEGRVTLSERMSGSLNEKVNHVVERITSYIEAIKESNSKLSASSDAHRDLAKKVIDICDKVISRIERAETNVASIESVVGKLKAAMLERATLPASLSQRLDAALRRFRAEA